MSTEVIILTGTVSPDGPAPLWGEVFPTLIQPDEVSLYDAFDADAGSIFTRDFPYRPSDDTAQWLGSSDILVHADGYAYCDAASTERCQVDTDKTDVEVHAKIQWIDGGSGVGIMARYTDSSNYLRAVFVSSGLLRLQEVVGGANTNLGEVAVTLTDEAFYKVRLVVVGTSFKVYLDDAVAPVINASSSNNASGTSCGLYFLAAEDGHRVHTFATS